MTTPRFFRVLPGFVAQFGISAYPPVNAAWEKATIQDDPVKEGNKKYAVIFATAGPNTRTTQLFINFVDNPRLDAMGFAAFGQVTDGMNVVDTSTPNTAKAHPPAAAPTRRNQKQGKPYLDKDFPNLDYVKTTTLIRLPAAATHKTLPAKKTVPQSIDAFHSICWTYEPQPELPSIRNQILPIESLAPPSV